MLSYAFLSHMTYATLIAMAEDLVKSVSERAPTRDERDSWTHLVDACSEMIGRDEALATIADFNYCEAPATIADVNY
jgi:hypothetical protein